MKMPMLIVPLALLTIAAAWAQPPRLSPAIAETQQTAISQEVTGRWIGGYDKDRINSDIAGTFLLELQAAEGKLVGSIVSLQPGTRSRVPQPIDAGQISGSTISFLLEGAPWNSQAFTGKINGDELILTRRRSDGATLPRFIFKRFS